MPVKANRKAKIASNRKTERESEVRIQFIDLLFNFNTVNKERSAGSSQACEKGFQFKFKKGCMVEMPQVPYAQPRPGQAKIDLSVQT